jgi:uncharacterized protein
MKILAKVRPNSKEERVEILGGNEFSIWTKAPAKEGKANEAVIKLLSRHFNIPKSRILIIKGLSSRNKVIDID